MMRDLGWPYGGQPGGPDQGAYSILEAVRVALTGFQPNAGCTKMAPKRERFEARDKEGGVWIYDMRFVTRTVAVENVPQPNFPLLTKPQAFEEQGQTTRSAAAAPYAFNSQNLVTLTNQNLIAMSVTNASSGPPYAPARRYLLVSI